MADEEREPLLSMMVSRGVLIPTYARQYCSIPVCEITKAPVNCFTTIKKLLSLCTVVAGPQPTIST